MRQLRRILVYGYGNPGRQDDGLGVLLSEHIEKWATENKVESIQTDSNYQLNIEDASRISSFDMVIFADASKEDIDGFRFTPLKPSPRVDFTMHSVSPGFILNLCREMYHSNPTAYLMHIKGYEWEFMGDVTVTATENLHRAEDFLKKFLQESMNNNTQSTKIVSDKKNKK